jgi:Xaa-Pro aminopeptidase
MDFSMPKIFFSDTEALSKGQDPATKQRRQAALRQIMQDNNLNALLLKNRRNISYYSGFAGDDSYLLVTADELFLLSDGRFIAQAAAETPEAKFLCRSAKQSHFEMLHEICREHNISEIGFEGGVLSYAEWHSLQQACPNIKLTDASQIPLAPRLIKDEYELLCLKHCGEIADFTLEQIKNLLTPGISEKQLALNMGQIMLALTEGEGLSFPTIVAAGENSAKPHAIPSDYQFRNGDFVTIDFGCRFNGYCGDCTRTFAIGEPSAEQRTAYELVLRAQEHALTNIKPGMTAAEADKLARDVIAEGGMGEYFSHSLGHGVGLDIHEAPTIGPGSKVVLKPGMLITVEPGVYIPGKFGLRIEDSCIVTADGLQPLTHFPKELIICR